MMFKWFKKVVKDYVVEDANFSLFDKITDLELRVLKLEEENIGTTNCLYEIMQSIDEVNIKIDKIHPVIYNLNSKNWDQ